MQGSSGADLALQWTYVVCSSSQYAVISGNDTITCESCPSGADCSGNDQLQELPSSLMSGATTSAGVVGVVTQSAVAAQPGYWASSDTNSLNFYPCFNPAACLAGSNGTRSKCATGYTGTLCSVCDIGYFQKYTLCVQCKEVLVSCCSVVRLWRNPRCGVVDRVYFRVSCPLLQVQP